jgi:hypothetical protein
LGRRQRPSSEVEGGWGYGGRTAMRRCGKWWAGSEGRAARGVQGGGRWRQGESELETKATGHIASSGEVCSVSA